MSDENGVSKPPPDPGNQIPVPEEPAGQIEPPYSGEAMGIEMPAGWQGADPAEETIPPVEEHGVREEYIGTPPPAAQTPEKKNKRTIWIIAIVVLIVLCCCCLLMIGLVVRGGLPMLDPMRDWNLLPNPAYFI
ncbi:MAG TPA: hypothetical protein VLH56_03555 [Dissulfurispiraceae bacterium]|nr:hypothetical protein [Dissulfurispiraceae bacterium]